MLQCMNPACCAMIPAAQALTKGGLVACCAECAREVERLVKLESR